MAVKVSDIHAGNLVRLISRRGGDVVAVVAVGKYAAMTPSTPHIVEWKGDVFHPTQWYIPDPRLTSKRVVTLHVRPEENARISVLPVTSVAHVLSEMAALDWFNTMRIGRKVADLTRNANNRRNEFEAVITYVVRSIAGISKEKVSMSYTYQHDPYKMLSDNKGLIQKMIVLWLTYCYQHDVEVIPDEPVLDLRDSFLDAVRGLEEASIERTIAQQEAARQSTAVRMDSDVWCSPFRIDDRVISRFVEVP